jgi:hypothetical protein
MAAIRHFWEKPSREDDPTLTETDDSDPDEKVMINDIASNIQLYVF